MKQTFINLFRRSKNKTFFARIQSALIYFFVGSVFVVLLACIAIQRLHFSFTLTMFLLLGLFVLVAFISIVFSYFIARRLSKPLSIIENHMRNIEVGAENSKINYPMVEGDAMSQLVDQYNTMIDRLAISAEELAQTEREKTWRDMARQMAHEIKNPLTPMKLLAQRLLILDAEAPEYKEIVHSSAEVLLHSIDDITATTNALSNFARIPMASPEQVDLIDCIKYTVFLFRNNFDNANIHFHSDVAMARVLVDKELICHVFNNLLKNALQAIPRDRMGEICVRVRADEHQVYASVSDNGEGILDENRDKIFNVNFSTKIHGMGLGLVVVKNVVEQAGGTITFTTEPNKGSEFVVSLPIHK